MKIKIHWRRLVWLIFIILYTGLFFYNCLSPNKNWLVPYIYTMILIVWLGKEYYHKHLFFQSGSLPGELYNFLLRGLFALFFYSAFVIGIITIVGWHNYQIPLYPVVQIIGVVMLLYSILQRERAFKRAKIDDKFLTKFYLTTFLLIISLAFGYGSYFLFVYGIIIGLPLIIMQYYYEKRLISEFSEFLRDEEKRANSKADDYEILWKKFRDKKLARPRK